MSSVASSALKNLFGGGQSPLPWRVAATGHEVLVKKPVAQDPTMKTDVHLPLAFLRPARLFGFFFLTALLCAPQASAAAKKDADKKDAEKGVSDNPIVLVPPFENQSKIQQRIAYDVGARDDDRPLRQLMVDRLSQAPRSLLEDLLTNIENVTVVERQRIDSFLVETEFGALSGLVDQEKAAKLGKLLGANLIVMGTIIDIRADTRDFRGYGVRSQMVDVQCQIRIRLLDIATGTVRFSKTLKGTKQYSKTSFGETNSTDWGFAAIEATLEKLKGDAQFEAALFGKKAEVDPAETLVEVEFAPKPENCDIEIDGKYVGGSPLKRRLPAGKEVKIRIAKEGYKDWKGVVSPEEGLRITRELGRSR
jgi:curli biogenesis system outer membrane secretion channel CsgG